MLHPHLNRQDFKKWLEQYRNDLVVGISNSPNCCPIANYLQEFLDDYLWLQVGEHDVEICYLGTGTASHPLPEWAQKFVNIVDGKNDEEMDISSNTALKILSRIEKEKE